MPTPFAAVVTAMAGLASTAALAASDPAIAQAQAELRAGCAQSYASHIAHYPAGTAPEYRGDRYPGDTGYYSNAKPCTEAQLAAYLDKAEPTLVMRAYPTAAGRPKTGTSPKRETQAPASPASAANAGQ